MFSIQGQDNEIQSDSTDSSNTQPSNWQGPKQKSFIISACVPFATFRSNLSSGLVYCWVRSRTGFEPVSSSAKVSCNVFALLACESVTSSTKVSYGVFTLLARDAVIFKKKVSRHAFGFASLAFEPRTSTNSSAKAATGVQGSAVKTKSNDALPFGGKSIKSFGYALLFSDKPSSTYWLVVASVRNEDFNGQTNDSPAKQCPVPKQQSCN
jgi:hypothetical protein